MGWRGCWKVSGRPCDIRIVTKPRLKDRIKKAASEQGVGMSTFIKYVLLKELNTLPVYEASPRLNKILIEEMGKKPVATTKGKTIDEFLDELDD